MSDKVNNVVYKLVLGDLACFILGLFLALAIRAGEIPTLDTLRVNLLFFLPVFLVWLVVFYIADLYNLRSFITRKSLFTRIVNSQLLNSGIAALCFYLLPWLIITPRAILALDLVITLLLVLWWRMVVLQSVRSRGREHALVLAHGKEANELVVALNSYSGYGLFATTLGPLTSDKTALQKYVADESVDVVVVDMDFESASIDIKTLYTLLFGSVRFLDFVQLYEEVFGMMPLAYINEKWLLNNVPLVRKPIYNFLKRVLDIIISLPLIILILVLSPIIIFAQQIETKGPIFYIAMRVSKNNKLVPIYKFRTMTGVDADKPDLKTKHKVTRVGNFLRKTRLDEFPQLWNVLKGDMSLVGPRPEFPALVEHYNSEVPYYNTRHMVKPGLSGWAQVNDYVVPKEDADVALTRNKLSYDLYYVKNCSIILDIKIVLKTIRTIISRVGV